MPDFYFLSNSLEGYLAFVLANPSFNHSFVVSREGEMFGAYLATDATLPDPEPESDQVRSQTNMNLKKKLNDTILQTMLDLDKDAIGMKFCPLSLI